MWVNSVSRALLNSEIALLEQLNPPRTLSWHFRRAARCCVGAITVRKNRPLSGTKPRFGFPRSGFRTVSDILVNFPRRFSNPARRKVPRRARCCVPDYEINRLWVPLHINLPETPPPIRAAAGMSHKNASNFNKPTPN